jgi:hypothetical protein
MEYLIEHPVNVLTFGFLDRNMTKVNNILLALMFEL